MNPMLWLMKALTKARPHLRSRALWAAVFALVALVLQAAAPAPPPPSADGVAAMLGAAVGGEVRADDFVWEARGGFWSDAVFGRWVLFLARRAGSAQADLYRARVHLTRGGRPLRPSAVRNLTRSPLGDDRDLVALGHHAAYVTSAFGAVQGMTVLELDGEGDAREARSWSERTASALESWLATGSTRGIGRTEITFASPPLDAHEELQGDLLVMALGKEALPAALDLRDGSLNTGPNNAFAATAQRVPHRAPAIADVAVEATGQILGTGAALGLRSLLDATAGRRRGSTKPLASPPTRPVPVASPPHDATSDEGWPPPPLVGPIRPALPGEGAWSPGPIEPRADVSPHPAVSAPPCFFETTIRPDAQRPDALVWLVTMDTRQIDLRLVAGVDEPRSEVGLHGPGRMPEEASAERAVAAFTGGPAERHAVTEPGFVVDRRVLVPPSPGLPTVAIAGDGRAYLGAWGGNREALAAFTSVRQAPGAILGGSDASPPTLPAAAKMAPVRPLEGASEPAERSALGLTRSGQLVYAWSARSSAETLARALELAGCTFAVPLAVEPAPVGFVYLGAGAQAVAPEMSLSAESLAGRSPNDLFYAVLHAAGPPPPAGGGAGFAADGGKQPRPEWLPAIQVATVVSLGAQVHLTTFAPGRLAFRMRPGSKEPATKAVSALPTALPEGEAARLLAAIGLSAGRKHGARGLIIDGAVGLPFRAEDAGALVVDHGRPRVLRASEVTPAPPVDATELPLTADDGKLRAEARDVGTMRPRAAACALEDGTFVVAATTFDSDEANTTALLDLGCSRVVALDRGSHQAAFIHRAGTETAPEPHYEVTALYALEVPLAGRAGPLP